MILYKASLIFRVVPEVVQSGSDMVPVSLSHLEMTVSIGAAYIYKGGS